MKYPFARLSVERNTHTFGSVFHKLQNCPTIFCLTNILGNSQSVLGYFHPTNIHPTEYLLYRYSGRRKNCPTRFKYKGLTCPT